MAEPWNRANSQLKCDRNFLAAAFGYVICDYLIWRPRAQ